jgi:hypothetical protein
MPGLARTHFSHSLGQGTRLAQLTAINPDQTICFTPVLVPNYHGFNAL